MATQGIPPLILDADLNWLGGRLAGGDDDCFTYNGQQWSFPPEHGVHAVWGNYANLRHLIDQFTPTKLCPSDGEEWINRWGRAVRRVEAGNAVRSKWIPAPFHYMQLLFRPRFWATITPLDFLSLPGFLFSIAIACGFDPIKEKIALDGLTMREFFRAWTPNLRATFKGLGANLLASPPDAISYTSFIAALRFYTVLRRDAWNMAYFPTNAGNGLIIPLVSTIEAHGGKIWRGTTATKLVQRDGLWHITLEDAPARISRTVYAQHVIIATNAPSAQRLLMDSPSTSALAKDVHFPNALRNVVIRLWFDIAPQNGASSGMFTGDFAPDNFFWIHRLYIEFETWAKKGGSAIELHFYADDALLDHDDRYLLILAVDEVQRAFPELKKHFVHGVVRRNSKNHTQFRIPTNDSLWVDSPWENIYMAGDWIGYDTPALWMERATVTGIASANQVLSANRKTQIPILHPPAPERLSQILGFIVRFMRIILYPIFYLIRKIRSKRIKNL